MPQAIIKSLPVVLTDEEIAQKARQQAEAVKDIADLQVAFKAARKGYKDREAELNLTVTQCAAAVRTGKENRPVEYYERPNRPRKVIEICRMDNGDVVDTREMTQTEAQMSLAELQKEFDVPRRH